MTSTKIITCLLGLALLIPLAASFWIMTGYRPKSEAERQQSLEQALATAKADIDAQVTPGFSGAMFASVEITDAIGLPALSPRIWSLYPRAWVGIVGLLCIAILSALWIYSAFVPANSLTGGYGSDGGPYTGPSEVHTDPSRLIFIGNDKEAPAPDNRTDKQ